MYVKYLSIFFQWQLRSKAPSGHIAADFAKSTCVTSEDQRKSCSYIHKKVPIN
jgi:hypothetical protein